MRQRITALRQFVRGEYSHFLFITAVAFGVIVVLAYIAGYFLPEQCELVVEFFSAAVSDSGLVDEAGHFSAVGLFFNNFRAMLLSAVYGFIPFVYFPAFSLGVNGVLLGMLGAYYTHHHISLLVYLAGILPHGIFELPALVVSLACGLYLCRSVTEYVRKNERGVMRPLITNMAWLFLLVLVPLLAAAAVVESYITPIVLNAMM